MSFPSGNFVWSLVKDENVHNGSLSKQHNSLGKKIPVTMEPGIPFCPPNYTKNRNVKDLLDMPVSVGKMPTFQTQSLRPLRARVQLI